MSKLRECGDEATAFVSGILDRYDVRIVLPVLGVRFAELMSAALAAGVDRRFVLEIVAGLLDVGFTPPEKPPVVMYLDGDEVLGRKQ